MQLDLDRKIDLQPADFIGQRVAVLGSSGNGKTNSIALILEHILRLIPFTIFDPHNEYWGLCESYDILRVGKGEGVQIEAGPDQAAQIAEMAYTKRLSVLVEMLEMTEDERLEFVANYCGKLWQLKTARQPYGVVLEEAQNFIPETKTLTPALKQMKQFALEGRKFGISVLISTQRPAEVNKTVLGQCRVAFLHGVDIRNDVDAYAGMLPFTAAEVKKIALNLGTGECIVKVKRDGPAQYHHPVRMCRRSTFHVGDTPTFDQEVMPKLRGIDAALLAEMQAALKPVESPAPKAAPAKAEASLAPVVAVPVMPAAKPAAPIWAWMLVAQWRYYQQHTVPAERLEAVKLQFELEQSLHKERQGAVVPVLSPLPTMGDWDGRTELATKRAKTRQQSQFDAMMRDIKKFPKMHRVILTYLTQREHQSFDESSVARFTGYARGTLENARPRQLENMKLLRYDLRADRSTYEYRSTVRSLFKELYPDLDTDILVDRIAHLVSI